MLNSLMIGNSLFKSITKQRQMLFQLPIVTIGLKDGLKHRAEEVKATLTKALSNIPTDDQLVGKGQALHQWRKELSCQTLRVADA